MPFPVAVVDLLDKGFHHVDTGGFSEAADFIFDSIQKAKVELVIEGLVSPTSLGGMGLEFYKVLCTAIIGLHA